jgi:hypothetical protein
MLNSADASFFVFLALVCFAIAVGIFATVLSQSRLDLGFTSKRNI